MKRLLMAAIFLCSCGAYPVAKTTPQPYSQQNFTIKVSWDKAWDKLLQYIFINQYSIRSQFKGESNASVRLELKNAGVTYIDPKTKNPKDTSALALSQIRYRPGNRNEVYPVAGNFECVINLNKTSDNLIYVSVMMDKTCVLTQFWENYYLEKRHRWPGVEIESSGRLEKTIQQHLESTY